MTRETNYAPNLASLYHAPCNAWHAMKRNVKTRETLELVKTAVRTLTRFFVLDYGCYNSRFRIVPDREFKHLNVWAGARKRIFLKCQFAAQI